MSDSAATWPAGLCTWLGELGLERHAETVAEWADEMGVRDFKELLDHMHELLSRLELKVLERSRLEGSLEVRLLAFLRDLELAHYIIHNYLGQRGGGLLC